MDNQTEQSEQELYYQKLNQQAEIKRANRLERQKWWKENGYKFVLYPVILLVSCLLICMLSDAITRIGLAFSGERKVKKIIREYIKDNPPIYVPVTNYVYTNILVIKTL